MRARTWAGVGGGSGLVVHSDLPVRRVVEELLRRGADPNLVLADGAAAVHLAARARHSRGLRCLEALLQRGGDANAR